MDDAASDRLFIPSDTTEIAPVIRPVTIFDAHRIILSIIPVMPVSFP